MIPLLLALFYVPDSWVFYVERNALAAWVFIIAALTDWFDGWLARRWNQSSSFGAFLDPVADKLMVSAALLILLQLNRVDPFIAFVIIGREIAISALREWMAKIGAAARVAVHKLGKLKTAVQMIAISCLLYWQPLYGIPIQKLGDGLIGFAVILTLWSMLYYFRQAWVEILKNE